MFDRCVTGCCSVNGIHWMLNYGEWYSVRRVLLQHTRVLHQCLLMNKTFYSLGTRSFEFVLHIRLRLWKCSVGCLHQRLGIGNWYGTLALPVVSDGLHVDTCIQWIWWMRFNRNRLIKNLLKFIGKSIRHTAGSIVLPRSLHWTAKTIGTQAIWWRFLVICSLYQPASRFSRLPTARRCHVIECRVSLINW